MSYIKLDSKIKITQIISGIGCKSNQKKTLIGLGLNKINRCIILDNTSSNRGMIEKIKHLLRIENIN